MTNKVEERVKNIISEQLDVKNDQIQETSLLSDFHVDELDVVELIMAIEEEFGIEITEDEADKLTSVQHLIEVIENSLSNEQSTLYRMR